MSVVANMIVNFRADVRDFKKGTAAVRAEMNSLKGHLKAVGSDFGAKSPIGQLTKMLRGGGAIAGVAILANTFEDIGQATDKWAQAMRRGEMASADIYKNLIETLPVIGGLQRGIMGFWNAMSPVGEDLSKQHERQNDITRSLKQQLDLARAQTDEEKAILKAKADHENRVKQINQAAKEAKDSQTAEKQIAMSKELMEKDIAEAARKRYETELKISQTKAKYINQLEDELAYMSMTADEAERLKTFIEASDLGGWAFGKQAMDMVGEIQAKRKEQELMQEEQARQDSMRSEGENIRKQIRTDVEVFEQEMHRAMELVAAGYLGSDEFAKYGRSLIEKAGGSSPGNEAMEWNSMYMSGPTTTIDKQTDIQREMAKKLDTMIEQLRLLNGVFAN